jgi:GNAT superfamily N-acetyltransferase
MTDTASIELVDLAPDDARWASALPVLQQLRTSRTAEQLRTSIRDGAQEGFRFLGAFADGACVGLAGWRVITNTSAGRKLHVDDLVTAAASRSRGVGSLLLEELERRGRAAGCSILDLDSGVQRFDAHRFSLRERLRISAHHFEIALDPA